MTGVEFGEVYDRDFARTIRFLVSQGVPPDKAEEFAQAGWAHGFEKLQQLRDDKMVVTWVNTIAFHLYQASFRKIDSRFQGMDENLSSQNVGDDAHHDQIDLAHLLSLVRKWDREVLSLSLAGLNSAEICSSLNMKSLTSVRVRLVRARRNLRAIVERR